RLATFAIEKRLPTVFALAIMARDGLLMSYGTDIVANWRRAASYVDRILKGANPAETPVEQQDRFEFVVNLKTRTRDGVDNPTRDPPLRRRGDRVSKPQSRRCIFLHLLTAVLGTNRLTSALQHFRLLSGALLP